MTLQITWTHRHKCSSAWGQTHSIAWDCWFCPYWSCEAWGRHRISINLARILQAPLTTLVQHKQVCTPNWASLLPRLMSCLLICIYRYRLSLRYLWIYTYSSCSRHFWTCSVSTECIVGSRLLFSVCTVKCCTSQLFIWYHLFFF